MLIPTIMVTLPLIRSATKQDAPKTLDIDGETIDITLTRHATAKRITLRYDPLSHRLRITLPKRTAMKKALIFVQEQGEWVRAQREKASAIISLCDHVRIDFLGEKRTLRYLTTRPYNITHEETALHIHGPEGAEKQRIVRALKKLFLEYATNKAERYAEQLGVDFTAVHAREMRSRWGSCSSEGKIMLCWRLAFAPAHVMDYVIAHEIAHRKYMDHSSAFWECVKSIYPDYVTAKNWLKNNGHILYAYQ